MKMNCFIIALVAGLAVCGLLVIRHQRRTVTPVQHQQIKPVDTWQNSIRLDPVRSYHRDGELLEKLRREEERQRPQEGRN